MVNINTSKASGFSEDGIAADDPLMELSRIIGLQEPVREPVANDDDLALDLERELLNTLDEEPLVEFVQPDESVAAWRETLPADEYEAPAAFDDSDLDFDFSEALEQEMQPATYAEEASVTAAPAAYEPPAYQPPAYQAPVYAAPAAPSAYAEDSRVAAVPAYASYEAPAYPAQTYSDDAPVAEAYHPAPVAPTYSAPAEPSLEDELEALLSGRQQEPAATTESQRALAYSLANYGAPRSSPVVAAPAAVEPPQEDPYRLSAYPEPVNSSYAASVADIEPEAVSDADAARDTLADFEAAMSSDLAAIFDTRPASDETQEWVPEEGDLEVQGEDLAASAEAYDFEPVVEPVAESELDALDSDLGAILSAGADEVDQAEPEAEEASNDRYSDALASVAAYNRLPEPLIGVNPVDDLPALPSEWRHDPDDVAPTGSYFHPAGVVEEAHEAVASVEPDVVSDEPDFDALALDLSDLQFDASEPALALEEAQSEVEAVSVDPQELDAFAREFEAFHLPEDVEPEVAAVAEVTNDDWDAVFQTSVEQAAEAHVPETWPEWQDEAPVAATEQTAEDYTFPEFSEELSRSLSHVQPAPSLETISLPDEVVEVTGALDIPEVEYHHEAPVANDTLETDFADIFSSVDVDDTQAVNAQPEPAQPHAASGNGFDDIFADIFQTGSHQPEAASSSNAGYYGAAAAGAAVGVAAGAAAGRSPYAAPNQQSSNQWSQPRYNQDELAYDPAAQDDDLVIPADSAVYQNAPRRGRNYRLIGALGCLALLGVAGAFAYSWVGGGDSEPVIIRADTTPTKVQPENPGGKTVPNQDKAVYDSVAGTGTPAPTQEKLVSNRVEPVVLTPPAKTEERVDQEPTDMTMAANSAETNVMAPRRVQTMVVRADGTIVQPEPSAATPDSSSVATPGARPATGAAAMLDANEDNLPAAGNADDEVSLPEETDLAEGPQDGQTVTGATAPAATTPAATAPVRTVETQTFTPEATAPAAPKTAPVIPSRPADQPVTIVDRAAPASETAPTQVASIAANGDYVIQIASQPSADAARKSYADLSARHAGIIGGRGVDIKQAEIAGRGTFYRVRIPAGSKADANSLCARYKAAGGSCLVTR